jgi:hypothetical protein
MLDIKRLTTAIETRDRTYKLLLWISDALDQGKIRVSQASHHSGGPAAATQWLKANYDDIPEELRPNKRDLTEFGAFFSTYIMSSFDVIKKPGTRGEGAATGCHCELCLRIVNAPHLQAKKLCARDKRRAEMLMEDCIIELAKQHGIQISYDQAAEIVANPRTRRAAAYLTYGHWLIMRLSGESDGPSILALWRIIAWDSRGGRIHGFKLKLEDFPKAEKLLLKVLGIAP